MPPIKPPLEDQPRKGPRLLGPDGKPISTQVEIDALIPQLVQPLNAFSASMYEKFRRRAYKGHWRDSGPRTALEAVMRLREELAELETAVFCERAEDIHSEAADIGNIAMMAHDLASDWVPFREARIIDFKQGRITEDQLMREINPMVQAPKVPLA